MLSELVSFAIDDRRTDLCGELSGVVQKLADPAECEAIDCDHFAYRNWLEISVQQILLGCTNVLAA